MRLSLSLYWKVQLTAWTMLAVIDIGSRLFYYTPDLKTYAQTLLSCVLGLFVSNIMRHFLKKLEIYPRPSIKQFACCAIIILAGTLMAALMLTAYLMSFAQIFFIENFTHHFYPSCFKYLNAFLPWTLMYCFGKYIRDSRNGFKSVQSFRDPHTEEVKQDLNNLFNRHFKEIDQLIAREPREAKNAINELSHILRGRLKRWDNEIMR